MASPPFDAFIGPAFVIICVAFMMYGTFCAQVYYYWTTYNDKQLIQYLVAFILALETVHTALCIHVMYEYLVALWGDPLSAGKIISTVTVTIYFELIISSIVQAWYIYRIWRLKRQTIPTAFLTAVLFAHVGQYPCDEVSRKISLTCQRYQALSFRASAYTHKYATWAELYDDPHFSIDVNCTFGLNIALDASITSVLMFYLLRDRSKAAKRRSTRKMIRSLVNFAFSTGILTVLTSCGLFLALNVAKHTITFGGMIQFIAKLYANSMLAVLNARQNVVQSARAESKFTMELSYLQHDTLATPTPVRITSEPIRFRTPTTTTFLTTPDDTWVSKQDQSTQYAVTEDLSGDSVSAVAEEEV
ncbi:hypothetical protein BDY19DRAFT_953954 [Irpex rosettiformis]|uniref:Uncharacterized protein n=1 Tax=Irpex rosettiformis TaxID=378272 RepID=A0ACB8TZN4_9APHY|nr:hypothetical protein BDY19DRAFT_953954 [Irpex rosettiformis]